MSEALRVRFVTKFKEYADAQGDFDIPSSLNRQGLSTALNQIFGFTDPEDQVPFDFKINGNFLRQTLGQALKLHHISAESLVTVEFFPAFRPPEMEEPEETDGWISCIRIIGEHTVFSMYDGTIRSGDTVSRTEDNVAVKCFAPIGDSGLIAGDLEGCVTVFDNDSANRWSLHNGPVQCIETYPTLGHLFISGGADSIIQMWSTDQEQDGHRLVGFYGHTDSIQSLKWIKEDTLMSASLDRTIRIWDVNTGQQKSVLSASCGVLSADINGHLIITGHPDRTIRLWDTRTEVRQTVTCEFKSHRNWVSKVVWYDNEVFASASYDGSVKLWNIGTNVPLSTLFQHDEKVLALDVNDKILVAGGSDKVLHKYRFK